MITQEELIEIIRKAEKEQAVRLDLSEYEITQLPSEIGRLVYLQVLILRGLTELPKEIAQLKNLSRLYLSYNQLSELPKEIALLRNLSRLDLSSNQLTRLPGEIAQLRNLTELYLSSNQLSELPEEFSQLKNLSILDLSSNKFSEMPLQIVRLKNLSRLDMSSNTMSSIPSEIAHLENLTELNLSSNYIHDLPPEIDRLLYLSRFYLNFNKLTKLPSGITGLGNLSILDLSTNKISKLPEEIARLGNLTVLYLDSNELTTLPKEITELNKLIHLDLNKNPLTFPPVEIVSQGLPAIRDYLKKSGKGGQTIYEGKLLIVGQGGVGKTCLIRRLTSDEYSENQATTEGIAIRSWKIAALDEAKTRMSLNVWDFGGQEIYHATHQFFLTRRSLYILVWDARQEEEYARIDYWLNTIEIFAEDSPILLVMNKADERNKDLNLKDLKQRCPQIVASAKVSAKNGVGIDSLKKFIAKQAWRLPLMGTFWPSSWLSVRKSLEAVSKYHIPYKAYLEICKKLDIEESEAKTLSRYLHDLGIILHFQEDELLKDTIILKPEWGTDAVYKVLDAKPVQERNGILFNKDLPKIWTDKDLYPRDKYETILRLMTNFELAFPFGNGDRHIVTEFLSRKEPAYDWQPEDVIQFEYHYEFLPAGMMARLIVRMNEFLIEREGEKLCWREGAYFELGQSRAMTKINLYTRIAVIQAEGASGKELLELIRSHFAGIHKSIRKIRFSERIPCNCAPDCEHRFDYNFLIKCEEKGIKNVICEKNADYINVRKMLDRIETLESRQKRLHKEMDKKHQIPYTEADSVLPPRKQGFQNKTLIAVLSLLIVLMTAIFIWIGWKS